MAPSPSGGLLLGERFGELVGRDGPFLQELLTEPGRTIDHQISHESLASHHAAGGTEPLQEALHRILNVVEEAESPRQISQFEYIPAC